MIHLAFVLLKGSLLRKAKLPKPIQLVEALKKRAPGLGFWAEPADNPKQAQEIHSIGFDGGRVIVMMVPAAVPDNEADHGFEYSISSWSKSFRKPDHNAHLMVTLQLDGELSASDAQRLFTRVLASVIEASNAVGVYWGQVSVSHPSDFFIDVVNGDEDFWVMLWTGVSRATPQPDRLSLLSLGMEQLGIENLQVSGPKSMNQDLLMNFFQLLGYAIERGEVIPDGDTVGSSADERLKVRHEASPIEPGKTIWCIDY